MSNNFFKNLNKAQKKAVSFGNGPLLVLAGAGSGKTRALTYRAAWLILEKGVDPSKILLVTFTNKAALEMKERIRKLLATSCQQPVASLPFAGTFHSFCARILRREGKYLGISPDFLIYDQSDQKELIKQVFSKLGIEDFKPGSVLSAISGAKNELVSEKQYPNLAKSYFTKTVAQVYSLYQKLLLKSKALDFGDLLFKAVELFQKEEQILRKYQNQFEYILVDEYQDTNNAQYRLTHLLAKKNENLTVVGDCSQSIYSWRGADFRNILRLQEDFPQLSTINLERNYRSHQIILNAAFAVICKNQSHPILKLWTDKKKGEKIVLYQAKDEKDEAEYIIRKIQQYCSAVIPTQAGIYKDKLYSNFAVLYRTNAQSRVLEEAFLSAGIPYILVGGLRFYERREIKDCLAYLRLLVNPKDRVSYKRLEKLGKRRLKKFLNFTKNNRWENKKTAEILIQVLKVTGYIQRLNPRDETDLARRENIKELQSVASQFPNLADFLENVALMEKGSLPKKPRKDEEINEAVTLMTLHSAKGLEFGDVFIVGMEEGLFPHSRSMLDKGELEEERRLCYVGITRAKKKLHLTYAKKRLYFGRCSSNEISRFITDLPEHLIQREYASLL